MKTAMTLAAAVATTMAFAGGAHQEPSELFTESYSGLSQVSELGWTTTAGTWTKADSSDGSSFDASGIELATDCNLLAFKAKTTAALSSLTHLAGRMTFSPCMEGDEYWITNSVQQAALSMRLTNGVPVFIGWRTTRDTSVVKGYWTELSAPGVEPVADREYDYAVDLDYSCTPTRVRYSIDGKVLADAKGATWFSIQSATKKMSSLGFWGDGRVGSFSVTLEKPRTERATVGFAKMGRLKAGDTVSFSGVSTNDGCVLSGELSYKWYRTDAAGMRSDAPTGEGENYTVDAADYGHWVTVEASDESGYAGSGRFWCSELPVFYIDVEGGAFPAAKADTFNAKLFVSATKNDGTGYDGGMTIHVRGNSTAGQPKKPYKIKLDKKTNLLDLCTQTDEDGKAIKSKHWVLLANFFDESLMRNKLAYDLSAAYGLVPMKSTWVDVVINGRFDGCYQLCQQIRVAEERINIYDWSNAAEKIAEKAVEANPALTNDVVTADAVQSELENLLETNCLWMTSGKFTYLGTNYTVKAKGSAGVDENGVTVVWKKFSTDISGGYVFELDSKKTACEHGAKDSFVEDSFVITNKTALGELRPHVAMNTPEHSFSNPEVFAKVHEVWQDISDAALDPDGCDTKGRHYSEICDFDSLVGYWLAEYVPANLSALSRYSYQDVGGKMVFGPAWDYDYALGSLQVRSGGAVPGVGKSRTDEKGQVHYADNNPATWGHLQNNQNLLGQWTKDPYFSFKVRELYFATHAELENIVADGGLIDQYRTKLATSAAANDLRWNNRIGFAGTADDEGDVDVLKRFFVEHIAWLDSQFETVGKAVANATTTGVNQKLWYKRNAAMTIGFAGTTAREGSVETDMTDAKTPNYRRNESVRVEVAVPDASAASLKVCVNGFRLSDSVGVAAQQASFDLPFSLLRRGETNFIAVDACDASGAVLVRNTALLTCPQTGGAVFFR